MINIFIKKIQRVLAKTTVYLTLALMLSGQSFASQSVDIKRMEEVVQSYVKAGVFMGSVLVAQDNNVLLSGGYGSASIEKNVANTPQSIFRIASISKQFTAAAILLLEQNGKLFIDDKISQYIPDSPNAWSAITFKHLLTHSSGITDFTQRADYSRLKITKLSVNQLVDTFKHKPLDFEPGKKMQYSNSGYVLLGYLLEKISGESYSSFIKNKLLNKLQMNDSGYDSPASLTKKLAIGYKPGQAGPVNADYIDMSTVYAAGGIYSTTQDLLRWTQGLFSGGLLSTKSLDKMTAEFKGNYGFGLSITNHNGMTRYQHGGSIDGFTSEIIYYPKQKITVIVLSNLFGSAPSEIAPLLADLALGNQVVLKHERTQIELTNGLLKACVGVYQMERKGVNTNITLLDNQLFAQLPGMPLMAMFAMSDSKFFVKEVDVQIEFLRSETEKYLKIIIDIRGRSITGTQISDNVEKRTEINMGKKDLTEYSGTYQVRPGFDIVITAIQEGLIAKGTGQPAINLYAETKTLFFAKTADIKVEFHRADNGKISHLFVLSGPNKAKASRK